MAKHCEAEVWRGGAGASVADPVSEEDEDRAGDHGSAWAGAVEGVDYEGGGEDEGKEEGGGEPIYYAGRRGIECCGSVGDGGEGEPLRVRLVSEIISDRNRCRMEEMLTSQLTMILSKIN